MKQNLHYFFSILLTIILLSPPAAVWADDAPEPLTFTALTAGSQVKLKTCSTSDNNNTNMKLQNYLTVSTDGVNFRPITKDSYYTLANVGDKLYVHGHLKDNQTNYKGLNKTANASYWNGFQCTGSIEVSGDLVSLIDSAAFVSVLPQNYCFYGALGGYNMTTLSNQQAIKSAEHLRISSQPITLTQGACESMMYNNKKMTIGPDFSAAMTLSGTYCFKEAFRNCVCLTSMGGDGLLNAETLSNYCYQLMFYGCTALTQVHISFPSTTTNIAQYSCSEMFSGCTSLETIGNLLDNITSIGTRGCWRMFQNCTALTNTATIAATSVDSYGCAQMYYGCTGLTTTGAINANAVAAEAGCWQMFYGCTGLTSHADINATSIGDYGCKMMFNGCTSLAELGNINITSTINTQGCKQMYRNCTALTAVPDLNLGAVGSYGCDSMFWQCSNITSVGTINATSIGNYGCQSMFNNCGKITSIGNINVTDATNSIGNYGCQYMFRLCKRLGDCSNVKLTAKQIGDYAYYYMFDECYGTGPTTGLTKAPQIEAENIGAHACQAMFTKCSLLTAPPDTLKAETLQECSYYFMFNGCIQLERSPVICAKTMPAATSNSKGAIGKMFNLSAKSTMVYDTLEIRLSSWFPYNTNYYSSYDWTYNAPASGLFICSSSLSPLTNATSRVPSGWTIKFYPVVTFSVATDQNGDSTGGTWLDNTNANITGDWYGDEPFPEAKHASKVFRGWVVKGGKTIITPDSSAVARANPAKTITLYAIFEDSKNFTFDVATNGATWDGDDDDDKVWASTELSTNVPANIPVKAGYRFKRWNTETDGTGDDLDLENIPSTSTTYYPIFAPLYTFDVNTNGGGWSDETTAAKSWESGDIATGLATYTPSKSVNDFIGWNTEYDGTGDDLDLEDIPSTPTTYYAIFTPIPTYTVTIAKNVDGYGSVSETSITDVLRDTPISIDDNELTIDETTVTATPASTTAEYTYAFSAWKNGETVLTGDANTVTSNMTITAHFTRTANDYTLTWEFDGGTTATAAGDYTHGTVAYGTSIVVPANPTKNGYVFAGWDATPASTMPAANTTYTAQWTAINYTFDVATNGGTWSDASTADSVRTVSGITALTTPQKDKFTFERWNTSADGTGTDMDASALPTTATKYYAIFIKVDYFRFIAQNATTTISTTKYGSETAPSLSYSTDNGATWNTFTIGTTSVVLAAGDSVCFRGVNANGLNRNCKGDSFKKQPASPYWYFTSTDSVSVAGNIMTLVQGTNPTNTIPAYNCFAAIMKGMPLVSAAKLQLPSSTHNGCYKYMFYNSSIRIAPELPALHVADSAYQGMFSNCQSLKIAPEIPATTVGVASMRNMFYDCWELTQAPSELKATQIYAYTYRGMFWTCKKLQTSPVIRATTMPTPGNSDVAAMGLMFRNCSTLVNVSVRMKTWNYVSSELSAAYYWLAYGSSTGTLTCPSALPTATRNNQTFPSGWTVNYIPELTFDVNTNGGTWTDESTAARVLEPETTWTIPTDVTAPANRTFVGWNTEADGTGDWLTDENKPVISTTAVIRTYYAIYAMNLTFNVATAGATWDGSAKENRTYTDVQFRRGEIPSPQRGDIEVCSAWVTAGGDTLKSNSVLTPGTVYSPLFAEYVCITAQTDNVGVGISSIGSGSTITFNLYYSTDGMNWKKASGSPFKTINTGEKLYLRGTNANGINTTANGAAYSSNHYIKFNITNNATVSGNLMTLIHPTNPPTTIPGAYCFAKLFKNDTGTSSRYCKITDASRLKMPATTMLESCYEGMFHDCNLLVNGPKLVATTLAANCYKWLFYGCSALRRVEVTFSDWNDDGSGNPAYTYQWMYGTTTNAEHNARFIGPAVLFEHDRNNGHIQLNWKGMDFELLDDQDDAYYTALKDMDGMALQQVTFKGTFPAKRWITFNVPFDFYIPEDHPFADHVYQFLGADGNADEGFDIHFQGGVYELEAGMPYLYYGDEQQIDPVFAADGEDNLILTIDADALDASNSVCTGDPLVNTSNAEFRGTVKLTPLPGGDKRYIFISGNRLYYPHASGNWLYAFSGYFFVPSVSSVAPRVRMMVNGQETSVEIEEFGADSQAAEAGIKKYIQDGVMVIERNGVKYDAQGHKLN